MSIHDLSTEPLGDDLPALVEDYLTYLLGLIEEGRYQFASDTIDGIATTIRQRRCITDGQRTAIRNIVRGADDAAERKDAHRPSRRYEGWRR